MVDLDPSSVSVTIDHQNAAPGFHAGNQSLLLHCTKNANLAVGDLRGNTRNANPVFGNAVTWSGKLIAKGDRTELLTKWQFGFLQFADIIVDENIYAGRAATEGSMRLNRRYGFRVNPCFDAPDKKTGDDTWPFTDQIPTIRQSGPGSSTFNVEVKAGDHPTSCIYLAEDNLLAHSRNFLWSARRDEGFLTVFAAKNPSGNYIPLAYFTWHILWHAELHWSNPSSTPLVAIKSRGLDFSTVTKGAPVDPRFAGLVANPVGPTANEQDAQVEKDAWDNRKQPFLTQYAGRLPEIAPDFFP